jgi:hypothetical protein
MSRPFLSLLSAVLLAGCVADPDAGRTSDDFIVGNPDDPNAMPREIFDFVDQQDWGAHHLEWHTVRQWDRLPADGQEWARRQNWGRAQIQEGAKGNGLEFLAMHRVMIRMMRERFSAHAELFDGWKTPPVDCADRSDPCGPDPRSQGDFNPDKLEAIKKLEEDIGSFKDDDALGLYIETTARPTVIDPRAAAPDKSAGVHNYLHVRFMDPNSSIDIGDPSVNLKNRGFWRIHGWLEARWTEFRKIKNLSDEDPKYQAAIQKAEAMLAVKRGPVGAAMESSLKKDPPPRSLTKFFEKE